MSAAKSAAAILPGGFQRQARVPHCEDWVLDKAFTWGLLITTQEHYAEIKRPTQVNRGSNGTFG